MTTKTYTDSAGDTLTVTNYGRGNGALTIKEGTKHAVFELSAGNRADIAQEILAGTENTVIEGKLPETEVKPMFGSSNRVYAGGVYGEISAAEVDYFRAQGLKYLAVAKRIETELASLKEEKERQERLAAAEKRSKRRNELAAELSGMPWAVYSSINGSTAVAIDRIIELEEAAK